MLVLNPQHNNYYVRTSFIISSILLPLPFSFLPEGRKYIVTVYADGRDADWKDNPQSYDIRRGIVTSKSVLRQPLASSGGVAISVREATKEEVKGLSFQSASRPSA